MALPVTESFCIRCGRTYLVEKFYKSPNPSHYNKVLPYCKECCGDMVRHYIKRYSSLESAMWMTCSEVGVPFIRRAFNDLENKIDKDKDNGKKIGDSYNYFGNYMRTLTGAKRKTDKWETFADTDVSFGDISNVQKHEESIKQSMEKFVLDWGHHEVEEYQFLEYRYEYYTADLGDLKPSQETLYRRLCLVELAIRKKEEEGLEVKEDQKQLIQLMKTLGIDEFSNTKDLSMAEKIIESQIAWMEQEEPAYHYKDLEKYRDFTGKEAYWYDHVLRPLKNLLVGSKEYTLKETGDEIAEFVPGEGADAT